MMKFLAQITPPPSGGEGSSLDIVSESINLARATSESWNGVWINTIDPIASGLWVGLVSLGITLAAVSILFLTLTSGKDIIEKQSWSELAALFIWPLVIMFFLGANGRLLANTVIFTRSFAYKQVQSVLEAQLGELTFRDALINGQTYYISERDRFFRYPSVIQNVIKNWTELTFNWDNKIPGSNETDPGIKVNSKRVPTSSYFASLLLEPEFGKASLSQIAELVPNTVFSGQLRSTVIISFISEPREIRPGEWEVDMVATRLLVDRSSGRDERIPFNRTFRLNAVEIQTPPLGNQASAFEQKVYELRSAGLEINRIAEFKPK